MRLENIKNQKFLEERLHLNFKDFYFFYKANENVTEVLLTNENNDYMFLCIDQNKISYISTVDICNEEEANEFMFVNNEYIYLKTKIRILVYPDSICEIDKENEIAYFPLYNENFKLSKEDLIFLELLN